MENQTGMKSVLLPPTGADMRSKRTVMFVLLVIQLVISCGTFILGISSGDVLFIIMYVLLIIYYGVFIYLVYKYHRMGILICSGLGILITVAYVVLLILAIIVTVDVTAILSLGGLGITVGIILIIIVGIGLTLSIVTVVFGFKLAKLLDMDNGQPYV